MCDEEAERNSRFPCCKLCCRSHKNRNKLVEPEQNQMCSIDKQILKVIFVNATKLERILIRVNFWLLQVQIALRLLLTDTIKIMTMSSN